MIYNYNQVASATKHLSPNSRTRTQSGIQITKAVTKQRLQQTHAEKSVTTPAKSKHSDTVRYIGLRTQVPYPVVPQLSAHNNYEEYIKSYERFLSIIPQIDIINLKRLNGEAQTEPEQRLNEFIQRRILKNQKRHAARVSRPPTTPDSNPDIKHPQKAASINEKIAAKLAEQQAIQVVQTKLVEPIVENTKIVKEAISKMETLRTQPIQILHVKTPETRTTIKEDKATGFRSYNTKSKPELVAIAPKATKQCKWCNETDRQYLPPCAKHPNGTHSWR